MTLLSILAVWVLTLGEAPAFPPPGDMAAAAQADILTPDTVLQPPGGPTLAFFSVGSSEVVSIRVSVPFEEAVEDAGAGQLLRIQAQERMNQLAGRVGVRAEAHRTPRALVYQVSGAVDDLDFMGWILREALAPPDAGRFDAGLRQARVDLDRRRETPEGALAIQLLAALSPGAVPLQGSPGSLDRMGPDRLTALWARTHMRSRIRIVAAGRVDPILLLSTLSDLGLPEEGPSPQLPPVQDMGSPRLTPEVNRHWIARGYALNGRHSPAPQILAARHLGQVLRNAPGDYEASVELWEIGRQRALVLSGAAYNRGLTALRSRLERLPGEGLAGLTEDGIDALAAEVRTELRRAARTPWGLADLVGQGWDDTERIEAGSELLVSLRARQTEGVRNLLEELAAASPVVQELRP
ncbi:MAG: hypothetical protein EA422_03970 [Gemmatimonadales bacterium]|nr:MAG: hypothetical protein EA422_03970 [Gemmatimonadales bacterium]